MSFFRGINRLGYRELGRSESGRDQMSLQPYLSQVYSPFRPSTARRTARVTSGDGLPPGRVLVKYSQTTMHKRLPDNSKWFKLQARSTQGCPRPIESSTF